MILPRNADSSFHCVTLGMTGVSWVKGEGSSGEPINVSIQDEIFSGSPLLPSWSPNYPCHPEAQPRDLLNSAVTLIAIPINLF